MDLLTRALLAIHVFAGFSSLVLFFVPAFARKGGRAHNRFGTYYVWGMWTVVVTALLLSIINLLNGRTTIALFLGFLAVLTARPLYYGVAVLRHKRGKTPVMRQIDLGFLVVLGLGGPYLIGMGLGWWGNDANMLLTVFGVLGTVVAWPELIQELRGGTGGYNWLELHLRNMIVTAIAGFTAFLVFGAAHFIGDLFSGGLEVVLWSAPTVIGVAFSRWYLWRLRSGRVEL